MFATHKLLHYFVTATLFWILLFITFNGSAQETWDLKKCIQYAQENNIQIKQAEIDSRIAESDLKQSKYQLFPSLSAGGSERLSYGNTVIPITNELVVNRVRSSGYSANAQIDLFRGFQNIHSIRRSTIDYLASKYDVDKIRNDVSLNVTNAYLLILFNREITLIAEQQMQTTTLQVGRIRKLVDAGGAPEGTALELEAQLAQDEQRLIDAQNQVDLAYLNLYQLLQLQANAGFEVLKPVMDSLDFSFAELTSTQIYEKSLSIMPEIKSAELRLESTEKSLSISRASRSPYLSLGAGFGSGYTDNDPRPYFQQFRTNFYRNIGLSLSIPIFSNYTIQNSVNRARLNHERAQYALKIRQNELRQNVEQAFADARASLKSYNANQKSVRALQESFKYAESRFENGLINAVDYNIIKNNLNSAESDLLRSKYDYIFKRKILDFFQGRDLTF